MKRALGFLIASCAAGLLCSPARAATSFSIEPAIVDANSGEVGDSFDVIFTNIGPSPVTAAAFFFEVSVTDPDITLTGADFSTGSTPYIFAGASFDQANSLTLNFTSGQTLDASDSYNVSGSGVTVGVGESLALGEVLFDVAGDAAAGPFTVAFTGMPTTADANNISDPMGNLITVDTFTGGVISVTSVPEPSSLLLMLGGMVALLGLLLRNPGRAGSAK